MRRLREFFCLWFIIMDYFVLVYHIKFEIKLIFIFYFDKIWTSSTDMNILWGTVKGIFSVGQLSSILFVLRCTHADKSGMDLAKRWGGKWQEKKARDQGMTASACHCPTPSSNSPVLLMLLTRRKLIWTPEKTAEPRTHLCPLKEKRHQQRALFQQGLGTGAKQRGFDGFQWRAAQCLE